LKAWLVWRLEGNAAETKARKIPYYANGSRRHGKQGSADDRAQLVDFDTAREACIRGDYSGVGLALLPELGVVALDFDSCVVDGKLDPRVEELVAGTYAEFSPSGAGVRAFMLGELKDDKSYATSSKFGFEVFCSKGFVTVTGRVLDICKMFEAEDIVAELTPQIREFYAERFSESATPAAPVDDLNRAFTLHRVTAETIEHLRGAITGLSLERIQGYDSWIRIGQALASLKATPYAEQALDLWHAVSARTTIAGQYNFEQVNEKWEGFSPTKISYTSIFKWAADDTGWINPAKSTSRLENEQERTARVERERERERSARIGREGDHKMPTQRIMTGTEMLEELVFLADGARVSFVQEPRFVLSLPDFKVFTAGSTELIESADGRKKKVPRVNLWVEHPERKTVKTQTFAPGRPAVCMSPRNEQAQNLWRPKVRNTPDNWTELAKPFFDHVDYLVPVKEERERFLDWISHVEQAPGVLPSTHYLMVTPQTGIGRNWMACALARVFAGHTSLGFDLGSSVKSGFNDELSQTLLAVVDELHEGGPGGMSKPLAEKLKSMLVETTRVINPKFGRKHIEFNSCRFLMFSNHEAALPLADNDRRVVVIQNPTERKPATYYQRLYALLDQEGFGDAIAEAFARRDISRFNPGEIAPMNEAKKRTIRAGRTELEQVVRDIASEWPSDCITSSQLNREVSEALGTISKTQGAGRDAGLVKYAYRVKVNGVAHHIWILRNVAKWANVPGAAIAAEVLRGETTSGKGATLTGKTASEVFDKCE